MTKHFILAAASLLALAGCSGGSSSDGNATSTAAPIAAPAGGDWTQAATKTEAGGMLLGNPAAPVKLVEYGALSCSHCAAFAEGSHDGLMSYVKKGTVSYEFRTYLLNAFDVPASLLAKCNGPAPFFPIADQLFATQHDWLGKAQSIPADMQQKIPTMQPVESAPILAQYLGLVEFVGQFGVSPDKAKACLTDPAGIADLEKIVKSGNDEFQISGTPTFIINGQKATTAGTWETLEPELKKAGA